MPINPGNSIDVGYYLGATQVLTLSGTAASTSAYSAPAPNSEQTAVRVIGNNGFFLSVGSAPVATSAAAYFAPSAAQVIHVPNNQAISVIQANAAGNVWCTVVSYPSGQT
jgi:hypothetical protein